MVWKLISICDALLDKFMSIYRPDWDIFSLHQWMVNTTMYHHLEFGIDTDIKKQIEKMKNPVQEAFAKTEVETKFPMQETYANNTESYTDGTTECVVVEEATENSDKNHKEADITDDISKMMNWKRLILLMIRSKMMNLKH